MPFSIAFVADYKQLTEENRLTVEDHRAGRKKCEDRKDEDYIQRCAGRCAAACEPSLLRTRKPVRADYQRSEQGLRPEMVDTAEKRVAGCKCAL